MSQMNTCPVCFTKMHYVNKDLVCPECGYKYCAERIAYTYDDHNHNQYTSYNKKVSYQAENRSVAPNSSSLSSTSSTGAMRPQTASQDKQQNSASRAIKTIITVYIILMVLSIIFSIIRAALAGVGSPESIEDILEKLFG